MADGLVELATSTGEAGTGSVQVTVFADLEALTEEPGTTGVAELSAGPGHRQRDRPTALL
jgi:hypothetical protein